MSRAILPAAPHVLAKEEPPDLADLRSRIDGLNLRILDLVERRGEVVLEIAGIKRESNLPLRDRDREGEMFQRLALAARGPFHEAELREVFSALFAASFALLRRAATGPRATPARQAAEKETR